MHGVSDVAVVAEVGLTRVQADPHPHAAALGPRVRGDGPLGRDGRGERRPRAREHDEERVALAVDLDAVMRRERAAEELVVLRQHGGVAVTAEPVEDPRRALDVGKEERDRPRWEAALLCH